MSQDHEGRRGRLRRGTDIGRKVCNQPVAGGSWARTIEGTLFGLPGQLGARDPGVPCRRRIRWVEPWGAPRAAMITLGRCRAGRVAMRATRGGAAQLLRWTWREAPPTRVLRAREGGPTGQEVAIEQALGRRLACGVTKVTPALTQTMLNRGTVNRSGVSPRCRAGGSAPGLSRRAPSFRRWRRPRSRESNAASWTWLRSPGTR